MRPQCQAQINIDQRWPFRMIICPEFAEDNEFYCEWHMERPSNGMRPRSVGR